MGTSSSRFKDKGSLLLYVRVEFHEMKSSFSIFLMFFRYFFISFITTVATFFSYKQTDLEVFYKTQRMSRWYLVRKIYLMIINYLPFTAYKQSEIINPNNIFEKNTQRIWLVLLQNCFLSSCDSDKNSFLLCLAFWLISIGFCLGEVSQY